MDASIESKLDKDHATQLRTSISPQLLSPLAKKVSMSSANGSAAVKNGESSASANGSKPAVSAIAKHVDANSYEMPW